MVVAVVMMAVEPKRRLTGIQTSDIRYHEKLVVCGLG
jgi:hypothetical protein